MWLLLWLVTQILQLFWLLIWFSSGNKHKVCAKLLQTNYDYQERTENATKKRGPPSASLIEAFRNEICGETLLELVLVLVRIVLLCVRHCARFKPAVEDLFSYCCCASGTAPNSNQQQKDLHRCSCIKTTSMYGSVKLFIYLQLLCTWPCIASYSVTFREYNLV